MSDTFLSPQEIEELTGKNNRKREQLQIDWLRAAGIPFWENARGRPIVARAAIEGRRAAEVSAAEPKKKWQPPTLSLVG
ncbi:MAG: DUF4224 domain-containing protein [Paraburkholderia sp.]|uniref:DUF4224 domain-containing protein n=1 Tax=Paraburkholderia sp. TaxID=1926495 RepID=UPI00397B4D1E